jgi:uncharacterized protein
VILVDTGPLVALFDLQDEHHERCVKTLKAIRAPIGTTVAVLTEAFHMLEPHCMGSNRLREFIANNAMSVWFLEQASLMRAFELMELYADRPMDLADASLVAAAEALDTRTIFTIDRDDFATYRVRRGHRHFALEVLPAG